MYTSDRLRRFRRSELPALCLSTFQHCLPWKGEVYCRKIGYDMFACEEKLTEFAHPTEKIKWNTANIIRRVCEKSPSRSAVAQRCFSGVFDKRKSCTKYRDWTLKPENRPRDHVGLSTHFNLKCTEEERIVRAQRVFHYSIMFQDIFKMFSFTFQDSPHVGGTTKKKSEKLSIFLVFSLFFLCPYFKLLFSTG